MENMIPWFVYMIQCTDGSLYTGISTDPIRRFDEHLNGRGAKYFNSRKPQHFQYIEAMPDRSQASKREAAIKKMTRKHKQRLIDSRENQIKDWPAYLKLD